MKNLNNVSLPLSFAGGKYSTESVKLPDGQYIIKIVATGPCIGKILKGSEVLAEVDFSSYKTLYNDLRISFILSSESEISLEVTPKREDIKVYSASLYSILLPIGKKGAEPTGTIEITSNGRVDVAQYATANVNVPSPPTPKIYSFYYNNEQYGGGMVAAGDGIGRIPSGDDFMMGPQYRMVVIANPEVAANLNQLYLETDVFDIGTISFREATVTITVINEQPFARIEMTKGLGSESCNEVGLYYNGTRYISMIAG